MVGISDAVATFERNIEAQTGRPVAAWVEAVHDAGFGRHGEMVAWLKGEHGLSHSHANHVAKQATAAAAPRSADDPVAHLFGSKPVLQPVYEAVAAAALALGSDVELAPKKANVSVRRRRQFALIQPSTRTRVDLGLVLTREAQGRLEASGSFHSMFTHRVRLESPDDVDAAVIGWLKEAYDAAA